MPQGNLYEEINSEEVQEIIEAVPKWILRWGITLIFAVAATIILLSSIIEYPDIVSTSLKVNSLNSPKTILTHQTGKLTALLVKDGELVKENQILAYLESTANPNDVLKLHTWLKAFQAQLSKNIISPKIEISNNMNLGELQSAYQNFYQQLLEYKATQNNGYYLTQKAFLQKDLHDIEGLKKQILEQKKTQEQEHANAETEYYAYQKLYKNKMISRSEFSTQENKYLSSKHPLQQAETDILNNSTSHHSKEKELLELEHNIIDQQSKFIQALNQCMTETDSWLLQHVLRAPIAGKVSFAGIVQQNQNVIVNQEIFIVNPGNTDFFGEVQIPQYNMGKINKGQRILIKLRSYPFEQYGMIRGKLRYISDVAYRDSVFIAKVSFDQFENKEPSKKIILKNGMHGEAEIITEESSLLQRFLWNLFKELRIKS